MTVGIVGLGLIGGSVALDLLDRGRKVVGFDADLEHLAGAAAAGVRTLGSVGEVAQAADLVVVAVPPKAVASTLDAVVAANPGVAVTDVASVKTPDALGLGAPLPPRYVGGHPMAGTERSGWSAARRGLLAGAAWMLTPHDEVDLGAFVDVASLVLDLQARPVVVGMALHDLLVAAVSHAPHLLAFGLHAAATDAAGAAVDLIAGPSFRDATRVAASDPEFWAEVVDRNRTAIRQVVDRIQAWLDGAVEADPSTMARTLQAARREVLGEEPSQVEVTVTPGDSSGLVRLRDLGASGHVVTGVVRDGDGGIRVTVSRG